MITAYTLKGDNSPAEKIQLEKPTLTDGEVLLQTLVTEVCGTDLHIQSGAMKGIPYPVIPGHFMVGRVTEVAGHKKDINGTPIEPGQTLVFMDVHGTCGTCWNCTTASLPTKCGSRDVYGVTHPVSAGPLGGWSEHVLLKADVHCAVLPDSVTPERYIAAGCGLPTALHAVERAQIQLFDTVLVQGAGPVGMSIAMLARASGAKKVIIIDRNDARLDKARELGFNHLVLSAGNLEADQQALRDIAGPTGVDVVLEATGSPKAVSEGLSLVREGGRYVIVGQYSDNGDVEINPHFQINRKHISIHAVWGIELSHFRKMIDILGTEGETWDPVIMDQLDMKFYSLDEINQALLDVKEGRLTKAAIRVSE